MAETKKNYNKRDRAGAATMLQTAANCAANGR